MQKQTSQNDILEVIQLGHPVLREVATVVRDFNDPKLQKLIDNLITTVMNVNGVGIAAPQVNNSQRVFILASHPNARYPYAPLMEPTAVINPKIISHSDKTEKDWEGCLSIPGVRGLVPRWATIDVEYQIREGQVRRNTFQGFVARIFQHELDHLDGIVFLDRLESTKDIFMEKEFLKIIAQREP